MKTFFLKLIAIFTSFYTTYLLGKSNMQNDVLKKQADIAKKQAEIEAKINKTKEELLKEKKF